MQSNLKLNKLQTAIKRKKSILYKLYTNLGKLTCLYINKNIKFISYRKKAKQINTYITKLKCSIKNIEKNILDYSKLMKETSEFEKTEFTCQGYGIYKFCSHCQVGNNPNAKICIYCGEKFNK